MTLFSIFNMDGYGIYVYSAYGIVFTFLLWQWVIPWRRWHNYLKKMRDKRATVSNEQSS